MRWNGLNQSSSAALTPVAFSVWAHISSHYSGGFKHIIDSEQVIFMGLRGECMQQYDLHMDRWWQSEIKDYWWQWNYMFKHKLRAQTSTFASFYSLIKKRHFTFKTPSWKIVGGHPWVQKCSLNKIKTNTAPLHRDYEKVRFHSCSLWL